MKIIASLGFASAAMVAILVAGCTTETADTSEGGVTTTGTAGSSAAGSAGGGGDTSTGGGGGTGGSSSDTDSGSAMMSVCETCAYAKCKTEADACEADKTGCGAEVDKFYECISKSGADETACAGTFVDQSNSDGGGSLANDLASCMVDTMGCLESCQGASAGDAGTHE